MKQNCDDPEKVTFPRCVQPSWSHISCITYMPGVYMNDDNKTYKNNANPSSFKRVCSFCKTREGGVVYCTHRNCKCCFHVLCGRLHECVFGWDESKDRANVLCPTHGASTYSSSYCEKCHRSDEEASLLLCDGCDRGFHTFCLEPPLKSGPSRCLLPQRSPRAPGTVRTACDAGCGTARRW